MNVARFWAPLPTSKQKLQFTIGCPEPWITRNHWQNVLASSRRVIVLRGFIRGIPTQDFLSQVFEMFTGSSMHDES